MKLQQALSKKKATSMKYKNLILDFHGRTIAMKRLYFIGILMLAGCFEPMPKSLRVQIVAEKYLDTLYRNKKIEDKVGVGFIKITDYLDPSKKDFAHRSKREIFKRAFDFNHTSLSDWDTFTKRVDSILSTVKESSVGYMHLEDYKVDGVKHTTDFFIDSACSKILANTQL